VAPLVDRTTDTVKMKARFRNPRGILSPNQSVTVSLTAKAPPRALLVPKGSVMTSSQGSFVFQAVKAPAAGAPAGSPEYLQAKVAYLKLGREYENGYEVLEGLKPGDKVVGLGLMAGGAMLREGTPVEILDQAPGAPGAGAGPSQAGGQPGGQAGPGRG
jgi:multidrug efflux pump subunit AcrA (membrane-fusion protein)